MSRSLRELMLILIILGIMIGGGVYLDGSAETSKGKLIVSGCILGILIGSSGLYWAAHRKDKVPDYFRDVSGKFFERAGFTFFVTTRESEGICYLQVVFQNQYERPCRATITVKSGESWPSPHRHLPDVVADIACDGAAFGYAWVPWPVPENLQGKNLFLHVSAAIHFPHGRGRMLRYRTGINVGASAPSWKHDGWRVLVTYFEHSAIRTPASTFLQIPNDVASRLDIPAATEVLIKWKLGDPPPSPIVNRNAA